GSSAELVGRLRRENRFSAEFIAMFQRISDRQIWYPESDAVHFLFSVRRARVEETSCSMPGIDFATVRSTITLAQLRNLVGFVPQKRSGSQVRGRCPIQEEATRTAWSVWKAASVVVCRQLQCGVLYMLSCT